MEHLNKLQKTREKWKKITRKPAYIKPTNRTEKEKFLREITPYLQSLDESKNTQDN